MRFAGQRMGPARLRMYRAGSILRRVYLVMACGPTYRADRTVKEKAPVASCLRATAAQRQRSPSPPIAPSRRTLAPMTPAEQLALALDPTLILKAQGFTPDPWQEEFLFSPARYLMLNCCRGAGKSRTTAPWPSTTPSASRAASPCSSLGARQPQRRFRRRLLRRDPAGPRQGEVIR